MHEYNDIVSEIDARDLATAAGESPLGRYQYDAET